METQKMAAVLAAVASIGGTVFGITALKPASAQAPPAQPIFGQHRRNHNGERHPEIRRALGNLNQAKNNLLHAAHDLGGHREQALDLIQRAIDQCQQALRDDTH